MILCVAPSPAWDLTFHVDRLHEHATNRARTVAARAGGKAINVARVLRTLDEDVTVVAPLGGHEGGRFADDLAALDVRLVAVRQSSEVRRTVTIVSDESGDATVVNERAVLDDWAAFASRVEEQLTRAAVLVVSGSLPQGAPPDAFASLIRAAQRHGVASVVDTSGPALARAMDAVPTLVKPNLAELQDLGHASVPAAAAASLSERGVAAAVSLGADGLLLCVAGQTWQASLGRRLGGNPTGAGDAAVAGFARGIRSGASWPRVLADAVALSAAAVLAPYAGDVSLAHYEELRQDVVVRQLDGAR